MPQIIVTAGPTGAGDGAVMLRERVNASDFESERFAANLLERLGWAVGDATEVEERDDDGEAPTRHRTSAARPQRGQREPEPEPESECEPIGVA
jgi:hypothetical protein